MKRFALSFLAVLLMLSSCTTNYYLVVSDTETPIYTTVDGFEPVTIIEGGKAFVYKDGSARTSTKYGSAAGYSPRLATWKRFKKLTKKQVDLLTFTSGYGYVYDGIPVALYQYGRLTKSKSSYLPSSSSTSTKSNGSSGGTVHVKGYTRKDGTYVRPHTRSAPKRH